MGLIPVQSRRLDGSHTASLPGSGWGGGGAPPLVQEEMRGLGPLAPPVQAPFELTGRAPGVRVVILGGGLAGMTVAYELGKVGYDCRVLEARARPGGRVFTVRRGTVSEEDGSGQTAAFDEGLYFNAGRCGSRIITTRPWPTAASCRWRRKCSFPTARAPTWPRRGARSRDVAFAFARRAPTSTATSRSC